MLPTHVHPSMQRRYLRGEAECYLCPWLPYSWYRRQMKPCLGFGHGRLLVTQLAQLDLADCETKRCKIPMPLKFYSNNHKQRTNGIIVAFQTGSCGIKEIGDHIGIPYSSISKIINAKLNSRLKTWPYDYYIQNFPAYRRSSHLQRIRMRLR